MIMQACRFLAFLLALSSMASYAMDDLNRLAESYTLPLKNIAPTSKESLIEKIKNMSPEEFKHSIASFVVLVSSFARQITHFDDQDSDSASLMRDLFDAILQESGSAITFAVQTLQCSECREIVQGKMNELGNTELETMRTNLLQTRDLIKKARLAINSIVEQYINELIVNIDAAIIQTAL